MRLLYKLSFLSGFVILLFSACNSNSNSSCHTYEYIHLAHIRQFDTVIQKVDPRVEKIDFDRYDMVLLGGDLTEESSEEKSTVDYLDDVFDLKSPNTLLAQGNHDNAHPEYFEEVTNRKAHFTYHRNGITWVVLNTQERSDWECHISGDQFELLKGVTDTIKASSHLVVMTHKLLWLADDPELKEHAGNSFYDWASNYRVYSHGWYPNVRPLLEKVQAKDIQVICLAGDIGNHTREFEERSASGIYYLASGSNPDKKDRKALVFRHTPGVEQLSWRFSLFKDL